MTDSNDTSPPSSTIEPGRYEPPVRGGAWKAVGSTWETIEPLQQSELEALKQGDSITESDNQKWGLHYFKTIVKASPYITGYETLLDNVHRVHKTLNIERTGVERYISIFNDPDIDVVVKAKLMENTLEGTDLVSFSRVLSRGGLLSFIVSAFSFVIWTLSGFVIIHPVISIFTALFGIGFMQMGKAMSKDFEV